MKYLRKFEDLKEEPVVGDYVIIESNDIINLNLKHFIENNIGQITKFFKFDETVLIKYTNVPKDLRIWFSSNAQIITFKLEYIKYFSNNKEELEVILTANKYNL